MAHARPPAAPSVAHPISLWPEALDALLALDDKELKALLRRLRKQGLVATA